VSANRIHPNDPQRILRALEVHAQTGRPLSELLAVPAAVPSLPGLNWVIAPRERSALHARLAQRFHGMLERGFINEVAGLRKRGDLDLQKPALRAIGYRAVWRYLGGELTFEHMVEQAIVATRQLAKRQYTWFRAVPDATWWDSEDTALVSRLCREFGTRLGANVDYT